MLLFPGTTLDAVAILIGSYLVTMGLSSFFVIQNEDKLIVIWGILVTILGFIFRLANNGDPMETKPNRPTVFFIPLWSLGIFWIAIGVYDILHPPA